MTSLVPPNAPAMIRDQAELDALRWVVRQMVHAHDQKAKEAAREWPNEGRPWFCHCALCRHARPWL